MLEWVLSLLIALGVAAGGVAGVTTAQDHAVLSAGKGLPTGAASDASTTEAATRLADVTTMISEKLAAAAEQADAQAQDALDGAAAAAAAGLSTASEAVTNAGPPADVPAAGPPSELPGPDDHPGAP
jgi:hypothetical protein